MKYNIKYEHLESGVTTSSIVEVEGESLVIPGYEEINLSSRIENGLVIISEVSTGLRVGEYYVTLQEAIADVKKLLQSKGIDAVKVLIAEHKM